MFVVRKRRIFWGIVAIIVFCVGLPFAHALDLNSLRQMIQQKQARWIAAETSVSRLPAEQRKRLVGLVLSNDSRVEQQFAVTVDELPAAFDWRDLGMVSGVRDQGNCGSCWAFSSVAEVESLQLIDGATGVVDDSEQFLVSYNLKNRRCNGGQLSLAADFLMQHGSVPEDCLPYRANGRMLPPPCRDWKTKKVGIDSWKSIARDVEALKAAVYENPIAAGFYVYEDFMYYSGGVYTHVSGKLVGGHGILIVGWDDGEQCFIVKNSWGEDWGENGYFRIAYSQVSNEVNFGSDAVDYDGIWYAQ